MLPCCRSCDRRRDTYSTSAPALSSLRKLASLRLSALAPSAWLDLANPAGADSTRWPPASSAMPPGPWARGWLCWQTCLILYSAAARKRPYSTLSLAPTRGYWSGADRTAPLRWDRITGLARRGARRGIRERFRFTPARSRRDRVASSPRA